MKIQYKTTNTPDIFVAFLVFILCVLIALFAPEWSQPTLYPSELG